MFVSRSASGAEGWDSSWDRRDFHSRYTRIPTAKADNKITKMVPASIDTPRDARCRNHLACEVVRIIQGLSVRSAAWRRALTDNAKVCWLRSRHKIKFGVVTTGGHTNGWRQFTRRGVDGLLLRPMRDPRLSCLGCSECRVIWRFVGADAGRLRPATRSINVCEISNRRKRQKQRDKRRYQD